jgi:hypothetical protein
MPPTNRMTADEKADISGSTSEHAAFDRR